MMIAVIALSIASFLAIILGTMSGMTGADFATGLWPVVAVTPLIGLPIAALMVIALVIVSARNRASRAASTPPSRGK